MFELVRQPRPPRQVGHLKVSMATDRWGGGEDLVDQVDGKLIEAPPPVTSSTDGKQAVNDDDGRGAVAIMQL